MGSVYLRGMTYWIKYSNGNGKPIRESSESDKKMVAKALLAQREAEISQGKMPGIQFDRVIFDELAEDFLRDYRINQKKSLVKAERSARHLAEFFKGMRVRQITTPRIKEYIERRLNAGMANATINRELAALKRMLSLGAKQTPPLVDRVPGIPKLKENNARKGFFEHHEFLALRERLPEYLRGLVTFAYKTGWRKSEITGLTWSQVDLAQGIVRLEVGETKNGEGRIAYLDEELKGIIAAQWEKRKKTGRLLPYVFTNRYGKGQVKQFDKSWKKACQEIGVGDRIFHDFRRTSVRNMVRAGTPERVAMMLSGHKSRSVFERYNIVNAEDLKQAAQRLEAHLQAQAH